MPYIDTTVHPLYKRTISKPLSPEVQTQLRRYCHRFECDESRTYTGTGYAAQYQIRLYGLRESCRLLVIMLVEPYA